jgi:hypothetical protein
MAKKLILSATLSLACSATFAGENCTPATEDRPSLCNARLPRVLNITFLKNGAKSEADVQHSDCSKFLLSKNLVRKYFARTLKLQTPEDLHHTLEWLPCFSSGTVQFYDGSVANWRINQAQTGSLTFADKQEVTLYCPSCMFKPFKW